MRGKCSSVTCVVHRSKFMPVFIVSNLVREKVGTLSAHRGRAASGGVRMEQINAKSLFNRATGFIARGGFDFTVNPYVGCTFGCGYCYAAYLPQNPQPIEDWGKWLQAKVNAVELARKVAPKMAGKAVYLSSVTDPYLP